MASTPTRPRPRRAVATALLGGLALVLALPACGSSADDDAEPVEVELSEEAATTDAPPAETKPTAPPDTAADTTVPATTGMATPEETARRLYDAWYADDRVTAATVAEPEAIEAMWETARGDYSLYSGCDSGEFSVSGCLFRGPNGTIQMTMEQRGDLWVVTEAFYSEP